MGRALESFQLVEIKSLFFSYAQKSLIKDLSFTVKGGSALHIVGPNGSGKSTLLKLLAGFMEPDQGKIELKKTPSYLHAETNGLLSPLSARQNLKMLVDFVGEESEFTLALAEWGFGGFFRQQRLPVSFFSTGMKRRLGILRVLLEKRLLWLLDEPFLGLDAEGVDLLTKKMREHLAVGGGIVYTSHEASYFEKHSRVLDLQLGVGNSYA